MGIGYWLDAASLSRIESSRKLHFGE
jgi:hypothetical protein